MRQGDVILVHFPFTDGIAAKLRPALIVSGDAHNNGQDVVVLPISSAPEPDDKFCVYVDEPDFRVAGLRCASSVKWNKPATISKAVIRKRLGRMPAPILQDVCQRLASVFS